jgi:hypothetical protein
MCNTEGFAVSTSLNKSSSSEYNAQSMLAICLCPSLVRDIFVVAYN